MSQRNCVSIMLRQLHGILLRSSTQQAVRHSCNSDAFQLACCRQIANAAAAPDAHRLATDANAAESGSAVQQPSDQTAVFAGNEAQPHPLQLPDPLETFRKSNISMPQLEGQVLICKVGQRRAS